MRSPEIKDARYASWIAAAVFAAAFLWAAGAGRGLFWTGLGLAASALAAGYFLKSPMRPIEAFKDPPKADSAPDGSMGGLLKKNAELDELNKKLRNALDITMGPTLSQLMIDGRIHNEKRPLTVLFADLENFTTVTEMTPPEMVVDQLNQLYSTVEPIIHRFKGHIDKYIGDALMAEFGAPYTTSNHPLLAVLAALRMQQRVQEGQFPWRMRIGVASGSPLVGLMGSQNRKNYTAVGDTVNIAARIQTLCPPEGVCVDEEVYQFVNRWFHFRRLRVGLSDARVQAIELQLETLCRDVQKSPNVRQCLEAAKLWAELGDLNEAMRYQKWAFEVDPSQRPAIEQAVATTVLTGEDRVHVTIKGKKERIAVYRVMGLKDVWADRGRLPPNIMHIYRWLEAEIQVPAELVQSIEALEGRLGRAQAMAGLSAATASALGLEESSVRAAFLAGYYCDVGKRNIPDHLLSYQGRLQDLPVADQNLIRGHVGESIRVLDEMKVPISAEIREAILQHHERYDGRGYPQGLGGEKICRLARILRVAETYEAVTTWRIYQHPLTPAAALVEIRRDIANGAMDPNVGKTFLKMMSDNGVKAPS